MINAALKSYLNKWWLPSAIFLIIAVPLLVGSADYEPYLLIVFLALSGILSTSFFNLFRRRWRIGIANLLLFIVCSAGSLFVVMLLALLGPSEDGFSDGLTIPENIEITTPQNISDQISRQAEDAFQTFVVGALNGQSDETFPVDTNVTSLELAYKNNLSELRRYLATSKYWRVFEERGNIFATRRWIIGSDWRYTLHGYYTNNNIDFAEQFQTRLTIGLSGKPWFRGNDNTLVLQAGETMKLNTEESKTQPRMYESHLIIETDGNLNVEIFEQSSTKERKLTRASLEYLEEEFNQFTTGGNWLQNSIHHGQASLELTNSFQPGIYDARILVNPGEAGMVYLKAFEVTKGTALSAKRLKTYTNEWIGWSDEADQLFFSNSHFTLYEGDWGKPYAARFEVWFVPDSGEAERKLLERVFKVEGWQR